LQLASVKVAAHDKSIRVVRKHLYNTTIGKVPWFIKRFGASELFLKPLRVAFAPMIIPFLPPKSFQFQGKTCQCFYHGYNMTWAGERMIEVPIAKSYLDRYRGKHVLEVGNVLSHYFPVSHEILDKFERGTGIINKDVVEFLPAKRYDLILSISTFEHIGFDDDSDVSSGKKIGEAIAACRGILKPDGKFVMTVPLGYNPDLDRLITNSELDASAEFYMRRVQKLDWEPASKEEALRCPYRTPFPYASALLIAEFSNPCGSHSVG
jgi:SAM-dependent methyltransferase